jgi:hypothetical protein
MRIQTSGFQYDTKCPDPPPDILLAGSSIGINNYLYGNRVAVTMYGTGT